MFFSSATSARASRVRWSVLVVSGLVVGCGRTASTPAPVTQSGNPSTRAAARLSDQTLEHQVLAEINRARMNPSGYADYLESTIQFYDDKLFRRPEDASALRTREGVPAVREAIKALRSLRPMPALALSTGMTRGARDHVIDAGARGSLAHEGSDGSMAWDRVDRYGKWSGRVSENMTFGPESGRDVVSALIVDDGVPTRGHRKNLFDPDARVVGLACGTHKTYRRMCDMVHAAKYTERETASR
jgi:uncharacterized protein YkwD